MPNCWWSPFDGMEQIVFKPVAEGFVYRAPNLWVVGPSHYYLVNETQKSELATHHRSMMRFLFVLIVIGGASAGLFTSTLAHTQGWPALAGGMLIGLAIGVAVNLWLAHKVQPIVAHLTPANDKITRGDVFRRQAAVHSPRFIAGFGILSFVMLALSAGSGMFGPDRWDVTAIAGTALFAACTIYWIALYVAKRRNASA